MIPRQPRLPDGQVCFGVVHLEPPYLEYHFWTKTETVRYTNPDSCITYYNDRKPYDSSMIDYDTINNFSEDYCDSLINGYSCVIGDFEPVYYSNLFGKGLGLVKDYYYEPAEFSEFNNVLFYYKSESCRQLFQYKQ